MESSNEAEVLLGGGEGEIVDGKGREYTSAVKKELMAKLVQQEARIKALEAALAALQAQATGFDEKRVNDHIWAKAPDAVYAALKANSPGLVEEIKRLTAPTTP
jgi:hypothetical protein